MAGYSYNIHDEYFDGPVGVISPNAFEDPMLEAMFDMSSFSNQSCLMNGAGHPSQLDMMTPGAFEPGLAGFDAQLSPFGQEPWPTYADGLTSYHAVMPMQQHLGSPPTHGMHFGGHHSQRHSASSRSNSIAYSQGSSVFSPSAAGYTSPSTPMSRRSSVAPSTSNFADVKMTSAPGPEGWEPEDVHFMGYRSENGEWRCKHEGCTSKKTFTRACDLRKHFRLHEKSFFCSKPDCPWARIGFSLRKDCKRHEASHKPEIECPSEGCDRTFSRSDNMVRMIRFY